MRNCFVALEVWACVAVSLWILAAPAFSDGTWEVQNPLPHVAVLTELCPIIGDMLFTAVDIGTVSVTEDSGWQ